MCLVCSAALVAAWAKAAAVRPCRVALFYESPCGIPPILTT